jgi:hypothetical protein
VAFSVKLARPSTIYKKSIYMIFKRKMASQNVTMQQGHYKKTDVNYAVRNTFSNVSRGFISKLNMKPDTKGIATAQRCDYVSRRLTN